MKDEKLFVCSLIHCKKVFKLFSFEEMRTLFSIKSMDAFFTQTLDYLDFCAWLINVTKFLIHKIVFLKEFEFVA